ncbi:MAG: hypothetical protein JJU33_09685 [Phycisphaerales bacterium]|nr:hypothetical protein [Phycisphaerales bacterium]
MGDTPERPDLSQLKLRRRADDAPSPAQLTDAIASGVIIKQTDAGLVALASADTLNLVIKTHHLASRTARLRSRLGLARLDNQWKGAARLQRRGFRAAPCLLLGRLPASANHPETDLLAMRALEGRTLLHALAEPNADAPALFAKAADLAGRLAKAGLFNRDLKPSNIIVGEDPEPAIIDTVAIRHARRTRAESLERMCFSLFVEPLGVGLDIHHELFHAAANAALPHLLERDPTEHEAAECIARVRRRLDLHPNPAPNDDPLA